MSVSHHPTALHFGPDACEALNEYAGASVLLVTDAFLATTPLVADIVRRLGHKVTIFDGVKPDPTTDTVAQIFKLVKTVKPEVLVAVGGGSPIDATKGALLAMHSNGMYPKFVVIPTTCGSGSEVTPFTIITDMQGTKHALISDELLPERAILTTKAVESLPAHICAETGMDALTHCLEAYLASSADIFADSWALRGMEILFEHLIPSVQGNQESRELQLYASTMAGLAFAEAGLGIVHSLAHAAGARLHLAHGRLNSVLLPKVLEFNAGLPHPTSPEELRVVERLAALATRLGLAKHSPVESAYAIIQRVAEIRATVGIADTLSGLGASEAPSPALIDDLAGHALVDPCTTTNPKPVTAADLSEILRSVW